VILQDFLERVTLVPVHSSLKSVFNPFILEYSVALKVNPRLALATIDHICDQILLQSWTWDPFISLSDYVIRPETLTYLAILMLFPLLVAVRA